MPVVKSFTSCSASIVVDVTWFVEPIIDRTGSLPPTPSMRVSDGALALADHVLAVDVRGRRQVQQNAKRILLQNRDLDDRLAFQDLACRCSLRFQQWRRSGHLDRFRDGPDLELHVDTGLLAGSQNDSFPDIPLEARA